MQEKPLDQFRPKSGQPGKFRNECKECERKYWREYKRRPNTFFIRLARNIRRQGSYISTEELKKLGYPEGQHCYICGQLIEKREDAELDHIIPRTKGGDNTLDNLAWAHRTCNRMKHNFTLTEFLEQAKSILEHLNNHHSE